MPIQAALFWVQQAASSPLPGVADPDWRAIALGALAAGLLVRLVVRLLRMEPSEPLPAWAIRERRLQGFVAFAASDGEISTDERLMLQALCDQLKLTRDKLEGMLEQADHMRTAVPLPLDLAERAQVLDNLIRLSLADGKLVKAERRLLVSFAARLGLEPEALWARVQAIANSAATSSQHPEPPAH